MAKRTSNKISKPRPTATTKPLPAATDVRSSLMRGLAALRINGVAVIIASLILILILLTYGKRATAPSLNGLTSVGSNWTIVRLKNTDFETATATTDMAREQGLSGTASLPPDAGMLFVYNPPAAACFWMKDMHYNLDILWFDDQQKLIYEQQNLAPSTYPNQYCPPAAAKYVLEINGGTARKLGVTLGDQLSVHP